MSARTPDERWRAVLAAHQAPSARAASWQLLNSVGGYAVLWLLMALAVDVSWWLALPLAVLAGALLVRVFIIFHDCGHGSFFASRRANDFWGFVTGVLTFTPYLHWRGQHAIHHGTAGNLDRRGTGDVWTMTVREYVESPWWKRVAYRIARNPVVLLAIAPLVMFVLEQRIPRARATPRERRSVWWTNAALVAVAAGLSSVIGLGPYLVIQLTVLAVAGAIGVWLFYLQHQFEDAYWARSEDWDFVDAALKGSSYLQLPAVLRWFTGNIGFHHVHHLNARIPNYRLKSCHESDPMFRGVRSTTMLRSIRALGLALWDETAKRLVGFRHARRSASG